MANIYEPSKKQIKEWDKWVESRPKVVRDVARRFKPWELYRMKPSGKRVTLCSFAEDGTVTVCINSEFNLIVFERQVFGVNPDDLEPCDPPGPDEPVGYIMSPEEVEANIDAFHAAACAN